MSLISVTTFNKIDYILDKALSGNEISIEEGILLWQSEDIEKLGHTADTIMKRLHPDPITTFVVGRNINYTNVCDTYCRFCAFYRPPGHEQGYVLSNEKIFAKIQECIDVGGTEILMQGGTNPDLPFSYYTDLLRAIKDEFPEIHMHSFSPVEIMKMCSLSGLTLTDVLLELKNAGLDSLPGGGAEILDDRIRNKISKLKGSWREWMDVMQTANRVGLHTTATMVIGLGETIEERVMHLYRLREAQHETNGFLAFVVWLFQPDNTNLNQELLAPEEYLKAVAIARIFLNNISNIQSSWVTMGTEIGKLSLSFGCNDFGSTMMEENVVSSAGTVYKVNNNLALQLIREAGKVPAQRNTKYEILRMFGDDEKIEVDFAI